jgi:hypothetical protein
MKTIHLQSMGGSGKVLAVNLGTACGAQLLKLGVERLAVGADAGISDASVFGVSSWTTALPVKDMRTAVCPGDLLFVGQPMGLPSRPPRRGCRRRAAQAPPINPPCRSCPPRPSLRHPEAAAETPVAGTVDTTASSTRPRL